LIIACVEVKAQKTDAPHIRISFMGDVMQHGPQIKGAYNPVDDNYNYFPCFQYIAPSIREADIAIANLELTLAGKPFSGYPTFSAPDELAMALKKSGIDVLVTANNHSLDRRKKGLERTIHMLDSFNIPHTGTFINREDRDLNYPLIIKKKGVVIALMNYTFGTNGIPVTEPNIVNLIDTTQIKADLQRADELHADIKIVFTHWGLEYQSLPNREQKLVARFCRDHGADMIIGSHPHVLQPIEYTNDFLVVYSLGNFVSNQRDRYKDGGMIFTVDVMADTSAHSCKIKNAGYQLTWVYKRPAGNVSEYFILPAAQYSSRDFVSSKTDIDKMDLFMADSRTLFAGNNVGPIKEYKYRIHKLPHFDYKGDLVFSGTQSPNKNSFATPDIASSNARKKVIAKKQKPPLKPGQKGQTVYRIQFLASGKLLDTSMLDKKYFNQVYTEKGDGFTRYLTGDFDSKDEAEDHLLMILNETKYKDAFIVERKTE